ncbi:putative repeat protein (TIGR04042 family) [Paraburkholderia bannensis]|uniref:Putative repeat protein (TIGR04042 family) n=1 Tax=Paraburkholderia bannensis TaxID=765414 RepID=A0A7W9TZ63_9BURK|nr:MULTISPECIES: MSMEG_0570 family nitrogen starvation response protein [Paraburkholderia]MBB3259087.1 putative repeat protein (TIGR04042 family) [Paraburkholderia sp. WP4_3_2]MBB6104102.1 putative repeat protein (TIGR04042 family) [Paraburkholderia bannensis]
MPVTHFVVRWPDGEEERCYSPSSIVREYLRPGDYPLDVFLDRTRDALAAASERVREKFGYACSSALDQWAAIERRAEPFRANGAQLAQVTVVRVD